MKKTMLARAGASLAAAALLSAGALFAAAPASAAAGDLEVLLENDTFQAGSWGDGISLTVPNATAGVTVTISAGFGDGGSGSTWGETTAVANDEGVVTLDNWSPENLPTAMPSEAHSAYVSVQYGDFATPEEYFSGTAGLTITAFVPNPAAASITPSPISVADATNPEVGFAIAITGFNQYEEVTVTAVGPDGQPLENLTSNLYVDGTGSLSQPNFYLTGTIAEGTYTLTFTGAESGVTVSAELVVGQATPAPAPAPAPGAETPAAPELAETGADLTPAFAASALLLLGAGLVLMRRRAIAAQR